MGRAIVARIVILVALLAAVGCLLFARIVGK